MGECSRISDAEGIGQLVWELTDEWEVGFGTVEMFLFVISDRGVRLNPLNMFLDCFDGCRMFCFDFTIEEKTQLIVRGR